MCLSFSGRRTFGSFGFPSAPEGPSGEISVVGSSHSCFGGRGTWVCFGAVLLGRPMMSCRIISRLEGEIVGAPSLNMLVLVPIEKDVPCCRPRNGDLECPSWRWKTARGRKMGWTKHLEERKWNCLAVKISDDCHALYQEVTVQRSWKLAIALHNEQPGPSTI